MILRKWLFSIINNLRIALLNIKKNVFLRLKYNVLWYLQDLITMEDQKPLFKAPYDIKDVSALFAIVAFVLIIAAIVGNNLFGLFQENVNFG